MANQPVTLGDLITTAQYYGIKSDTPIMLSFDDGTVQHVANISECQLVTDGSKQKKAFLLAASIDARKQSVYQINVNDAGNYAGRFGQCR